MLKKIIITLLLLPALVYLTRVGVADFLRLAPCFYVDALMRGNVSFDSTELTKAHERLLLARSWDAGNPIILEYLGQTDFILAQVSGFNPVLQAELLRKAVINFELAIKLRPNSSYLWAARMTAGSWLLGLNTKLGLKNFDAKSEWMAIKLSLRRSAALGPWEPSVLKQVVKVGTFRYKEFDADERLIIDRAILRERQLGSRL